MPRLATPDQVKRIKRMVTKGNSRVEIAKTTGLSKTTVFREIQRLKTNPDFLDFQENKDKTFEALQYKLINLADDATLKTMLMKRGFTDAAILEDKIRLIRGQATEISDVQLRGLILHFQSAKSVDNPVDK